MPRGDRTGPDSRGSRTGRGLGYCSGYNLPGYARGPGMGRGFGWGRGRHWRYAPTYGAPIYGTRTLPPIISAIQMTPENQLDVLKQEENYLKSEMDRIEQIIKNVTKRIGELENNKS